MQKRADSRCVMLGVRIAVHLAEFTVLGENICSGSLSLVGSSD